MAIATSTRVHHKGNASFFHPLVGSKRGTCLEEVSVLCG